MTGVGNTALWVATRITGALPPFVGVRLRATLLRMAGLSVGRGATIIGRVWIAGGPRPRANLVIGRLTFVNDGVRFDTSAPIVIGQHVDIAHDVRFITSTHEVGGEYRRAGRSRENAISVGDGAWIGAGAIVLPGVTIGEGSLVAAGAVVTKSVPANTLVAGVPAKVVRRLPHLAGLTRRSRDQAAASLAGGVSA
jgi:acetyltransferase-like isoleucine patch superfamily enzyme